MQKAHWISNQINIILLCLSSWISFFTEITATNSKIAFTTKDTYNAAL